MGTIENIKWSIERAIRHESNLSEEALAVGGFTSVKIRHLLNNLGSFANSYFEVGSHIGATFISTCFGNDLNLNGRYLACDSFSEFNNDGRTKEQFIANCNLLLGESKLLDQDCWTVGALDIWMDTDLYLYDGGHDYLSQKRAVTHFAPKMAKEFIMCVDDAAWQPVRRGTFDGIAEAGLEVLYEQSLFDGIEGNNEGWPNGFMILLLKRKDNATTTDN